MRGSIDGGCSGQWNIEMTIARTHPVNHSGLTVK